MKIILDVNIVISALVKDSTTRELLVKSEHEFYFPNRAKQKIEKYETLILKKSELTIAELHRLKQGIFGLIKLIPDAEVEPQREEANKIMQHIDPEDTLFIAAALAIRDAAIWSDDKHFQKQKAIQILRTSDLVSLYKK